MEALTVGQEGMDIGTMRHINWTERIDHFGREIQRNRKTITFGHGYTETQALAHSDYVQEDRKLTGKHRSEKHGYCDREW